MAHEVSFFHAMRKLSIERDLKRNRLLERAVQHYYDNYKSQMTVDDQIDYAELLSNIKKSIEGNNAALKETEEELQQAVAEGK